MNRFRLLALLSSLPACAQAQQVPTLEQLIARYECNLPGKEVERLACPKDLSPEEAGEIRMQKIDDAHSVVIILQKTRGVIWEIENVLDQNKVHKTLFMLDPSASDPARWHEIMDKITPLFIKAGMLPADFAFEGNPMAFCITQDGVVQIENDHWSTTSYRTAFSQFLAANAGYGSFDTRRFH